MNQPSAEEKIADIISEIYPGIGRLTIARKMAIAILDRYHLIDKTESVPGAVSAEELTDAYKRQRTIEPLVFVARDFDIYPKGTVARLMAELDRLKGEIWKANRSSAIMDAIGNMSFPGEKKPEAVGCGRRFNISAIDVFDCGEYGNLCPDCQKANDLEEAAESAAELYQPRGPLARLDPPADQNGPDKASILAQNVVLPEVHDFDISDAIKKHEGLYILAHVTKSLVNQYRAIKTHLENQK